jgi:hypothetical protein
VLRICGTDDGTCWPGAHRGHLLPWGAAVYVQCTLWCGQSCGKDQWHRVGKVQDSDGTYSLGGIIPCGQNGKAA